MTMPVPTHPKIYHIVHIDKIPSIVTDGRLWCDATMSSRQVGTVIGMSSIKQRRLALPVSCHLNMNVGDCVPFYFCPRSVMLYVIHRGNLPDLAYRDGQGPILHLEADLLRTVQWADANRRRWAFSLSNAGASYAQFRGDLLQLGEINWKAVAATDFRNQDIKEGKQAEFLIEGAFAWELVDRIGVHSPAMGQRALTAVQNATHRPVIEVVGAWYY
jgi:hypothetical protein